VRDILVYCDDFRAWSPAVRYAAELAAALDASLTGLHVGTRIPLEAPQGTPPPLLAEFIAYVQDDIQAAMVAGKQFAHWTQQFGVKSTAWQVALGDAADALCVAGNWNDVLVVERGSGRIEDPLGLISEVLLSGLACLVVPEMTYAVGRLERIAVAWNGSPASTRALHCAMPLLRRAAHVVLLRAERPESVRSEVSSEPAFDPEGYLRARGIRVQTESIEATEDEAADTLLTAASRNRADLLVMGAFGKMRFHEWYLGGTTRHILQYAGLPLFMAH
jgi:nucleotide-binding universal stress UspA family protein